MLQNQKKQRKAQKRAPASKLGVPRADFGHSGVALGSFSGALGWFGGALGRSWHALGTLLGRLGRLLDLLDTTWKNPRVWDHLIGHLLGRSWATFSHFVAFRSLFFAHLKSASLFGWIFFVSLSILGGFWDGFAKDFGRFVR